MQLLQVLQNRSLVLVLPQGTGSDQLGVVVQRPGEPGRFQAVTCRLSSHKDKRDEVTGSAF